jgi:peptidoglycan lytic transglycosylase G
VALTRRGRVVVALVVLLGVAGIPALAGTLYLRSIGLWGKSEPGGTVDVVIPKGASVDQIGDVLESEGVIRSGFGFRLATFLESGDENIQAGRYEMRQGLTAGDALDDLLSQRPEGAKFVNVTFPEGSWLVDFAAVLERDTHISDSSFMKLATSGNIRSRFQPKDVETLEGLLFPSTYQIVDKDDAESVIERLVREFDKRASNVNIENANSLGVTPYEAIIVASMIEAEAFVDEERGKIAAVIYNRLDQGIPLGIDATVLYALGEHKESLTQSDLQIDSPYNTRRVAGLPPTPIGAPGVESLSAALEPADGEWLYYVLADCDGNHAFSESYDEFLQDKAAYRSLEC